MTLEREPLGRRDEGTCQAPTCGRELRLEEVCRSLSGVEPSELIKLLNAKSVSSLRGLLSKPQLGIVSRIIGKGCSLAGGRIVLDSDGTNYLVLRDSPNSTEVAGYRSQLGQQDRILAGGAIRGEVSQEFTRHYLAHPASVDVWRMLARHGVHVSIISGRSAADLRDTYREALNGVPGFNVRAAKGRAVCQGDSVRAAPALVSRLDGDALGVATSKMAADLGAVMGKPYRELKPIAYEAQFGYRISCQTVEGTTVLIRLHHRFRACMLAHQAGSQLAGLADPSRVDMAQLSRWLHSGGAAAKAVLTQLQEEDALITRSVRALRASGSLEVRDFVGHRSGCQDFSIELPWADVIEEIGGDREILLYAGDNFTESGNDRPLMEAVRTADKKAKVGAVTNYGGRRSDIPDWMVSATQFELFLIQYLAARQLEETPIRRSLSAGKGVDRSAPE